ncbi:hypothetical protein P7C70_g311, partial [Phenoliferia sp. Uapishka_3]
MNFDRMREALDPANSPPTRVTQPPREVILLLHQQELDREAQLDSQGEVRTRKMAISPGKHFSSAALEDLKLMDLEGEVLCNKAALGKLLICRVITKCFRTVAVQFVVEDHGGRVAPVHLYHIPATLESPDLDLIFPIGSTFVIKEPLLRETQDGFLIRIDSPADLIRLYPSSPLLKSVSWKTSPPASFPNRTATQWKDDGNRLFALRKWRAAIEPYSLGLDLESTGRLACILHANRAATLLKLGTPGAALRDCLSALDNPSLDAPLRRKVLFRTALSNYHLQRFPDAVQNLESLLQVHPDDADAMDLYRRTQLRLVESTRGDYDWPFLFGTAKEKATLDIASFSGEMIESVDIAGRGRGLVAKRDIERGELLLVAKPFAMSLADRTRKKYVVGANLFTNTLDPYPTADLAALLIQQLMDDPTIAPTLFSLHPGSSFPLYEVSSGIDTSRIEALVTYNAFHTESLAQKTTSVSPQEDFLDTIHAPSTIYHIPSLMNHSCIGNVSYSFLADTIFLRARRRLAKGAELVDSYVDSMSGLSTRQNVLSKHGFVCTCDLCAYDRADGEAHCASREALAVELESLTDKIHGSENADASFHVGSIFSLVERIQKTYAPTRPALKPTLYRAWRLLAQTYAGMGHQWTEAAIRTEIRGLEALGTVFEDGEDEMRVMKEEAKIGDVNAVLSALFVAAQFQVLGKPEGAKHWIGLARRTEAGQAGEAIFRVRYAEWAEKHKLDLNG